MEWDFTPAQVSIGEINYSLEDFYEDLRGEIEYYFAEKFPNHIDDMTRLTYQVLYFSFVLPSTEEVIKKLPYSRNLIEPIIKHNQDNIDMLAAIIMYKFLRNLEEMKCLLNDSLNLELVNAEMRQFHKSKNL